MRETIREFSSQRIIGYIDVEYNGDKTVRDFSGRVLGYYKKAYDHTTNFSGTILFIGDMASALLIM